MRERKVFESGTNGVGDGIWLVEICRCSCRLSKRGLENIGRSEADSFCNRVALDFMVLAVRYGEGQYE